MSMRVRMRGMARGDEVGVQRVSVHGGRCWLCGLPAVAGERLPGRRRGHDHRIRLLCAGHAAAVFGTDTVTDEPDADDGCCC